jgi:hypothetical protein
VSIYTVSMQNQTIVADATLIIVHTDSTLANTTGGSNLRVKRAWAGQAASETAQQLGIILGLKASAFGTYTSTAPVAHNIGNKPSGIAGGTSGAEGTSGTDASAEGAGTVTPIIYDGFDNRAGWLWVPKPEEEIILPADTAIILKIVGTPVDLGNWCAGITLEEI